MYTVLNVTFKCKCLKLKECQNSKGVKKIERAKLLLFVCYSLFVVE